MPSYIDQLYADIQPSYTDTLYHYGVKGMRWGIRKYRDENGIVQKKARLGSAERIRQKQRLYQNHLDRSNDSDLIIRNTLNDYRRGRIAQLNTKAKHREAKEAYRKNRTIENKWAVKDARNERIVKNGILPMLNVSTSARGKYNRYKSTGKSESTALLATAANVAVTAIAVSAAKSAGKAYLEYRFGG